MKRSMSWSYDHLAWTIPGVSSIPSYSKCAHLVPFIVTFLPFAHFSNPLPRYGGPASQEVNTRFKRDWHDYLVCTLKYIVVVVDGRGTGFKGRALRNPVRGTLGTNEVLDQINAAR